MRYIDQHLNIFKMFLQGTCNNRLQPHRCKTDEVCKKVKQTYQESP